MTGITGVHLSNPNNSTLFSDCCGIAVTDKESCCPRCGNKVIPESPKERWEKAYHYGDRK